MAASTYARMREQMMSSQDDEEAVTVNTRALIDKVLARYSGEWTTLRELIQNAADAQAKKVTIRFETTPSSHVPLPQSQDPSAHIQHVLLHHTLKTLLVSNDGEPFQETDWQRLKRIAEGNPDETKIGAFGVGFYSVFADCESPFVSSGQQTMAFFWKKDSLFTRRGKLAEKQASDSTTFLLDYRSQSTPVPPLLSLCQFLATSLTFVGLENIDLYLDNYHIMNLTKKTAPGASVAIPKDVNPRTKDGLMQIVDVEYQNAQIDAKWMNVVGWNKTTRAPTNNPAPLPPETTSAGGSLRTWFSRFSAGTTSASNTSKRLQREEETLQKAIAEDLAGFSQATVFLRLSTVNIRTHISRSLSAELERATKKPPPKKTKIAILTSSFDESSASLSTISGTGSKQAGEIFASVLPTKNGKIFIGFPTAQTTGLLAHISAPSVIPTVERESIDLNARYVRDWNIEMLRVAGIACRIAYTGEMLELKAKLDRISSSNGSKKVTPEAIAAVLPSAIHSYKQFHYEESTPSSKVGQHIEEAFWTCNQKDTIDVLSTRGVLPSHQVRVATEDLSFVEGIPVIPDELMDKANAFLTKLRDYGLLSDITTSDIKKELEAQALTEKQLTELLKWACSKVYRSELDAGAVLTLFDGTLATISEEHVANSSSPVLQLGQVTTFVNTSRFPSETPVPSHTIPFRFTKGLSIVQLAALGWEELQIVPWLRWVVETNGQAFAPGKSLTSEPAVAGQILPIISKSWDALSPSSKQTVVELLSPRTVIPTKLGMRKPPEAYFSGVRLFDDLPTIHGLNGVKEKFLLALGVRKTVELSVVIDRLMTNSTTSTEEKKWSHVDLIKYLVSVQNDIPPEDLEKLKITPICKAEDASGESISKGPLLKLSELFEPNESTRRLGLPILQWPPPYRTNSPEARFLRSIGLQASPSASDMVSILSRAPANSVLQRAAIEYYIVNYYPNGYSKYPIAAEDRAFLPIEAFSGEPDNLVAKPSQCYANPQAAVLRFRTLRRDLQKHHTMFGVAMDPPINLAADRLISAPPADIASAKVIFTYFASRANEIGPQGNLAEKLGDARIVPIIEAKSDSRKSGIVRFVSPRSCFLGDNQTYGDIFDFVDFGQDANLFLLRIGSKHEPNASELAQILVQQPTKLLDRLGTDKYLQLLRKIAENATSLKKDKTTWQQLKTSPCLLAVKEVIGTAPGNDEKLIDVDDEETFIKEYSLAPASAMVLVDDFATYRYYQSTLLTAPQEEVLEQLYSALDTPWLSNLVDDDQRMGPILKDQTSAQKLQRLLNERCRLFLHDHSPDVIRHDAKWLEQNLVVKATEFLQTTKKLKGFKGQHILKRSALLHRESKNLATLFVTPKYDLYEVSRAVMAVLLKRPRQQDYLALETIMESDLRRLKTKGYNVDRILRLKAAESRIAESERQKREEEKRRVQAEAAAAAAATATAAADVMGRPPTGTRAISAGHDDSHIEAPESPDQSLSMPGAFDAHEPAQPIRNWRPSNLLNTIRQQLGVPAVPPPMNAQSGDMFGSGAQQHEDRPPPPYESVSQPGTTATAGTEVVSSSQEVQHNLQAAIQSSRAFSSSTLFTPPETNVIKETPSYCDSRPGQDLVMVNELSNGIKLFLPRSHHDHTGFLRAHKEQVATFSAVLMECAKIFDLPLDTVNIFHDVAGASIAFNTNGSIFCNLRYFNQLHFADMASIEGKIEALVYWFVTLCHELAHNLVTAHNAQHSYYTESFVSHYFRRILWVAGRAMNSQG